jgi:predicted flap endonuclease-1-like 5' DNA nuclease
MFLDDFSFDLEQLKGIGKQVATSLATLKVFSVRQLLMLFPRK